MKLNAKLGAPVVAALLLLQPLGAASACWQSGTTTAGCASGCPMPHQSSKTHPVKAQAADPACCEISSSEPAPLATAVKGVETIRASFVAPAVSALSTLRGLTSAAVSPNAPFERTSSTSLNALYCVFLI